MANNNSNSNISFDEYLKTRERLNKLKEDKQMWMEEAQSYMPNFNDEDFEDGDYTWEDDMAMDEIYAEILPPIIEKIEKLEKKCKNFNLQLKKAIYQEFIKRKLHPDNVMRYMIEKNIEFLDISFEDLLME
jgi:uncharacterized protein (UPF0335 family)